MLEYPGSRSSQSYLCSLWGPLVPPVALWVVSLPTSPLVPPPSATHASKPEPESPEPDKDGQAPSIPPPLNIPPSRARRQLAARLAQKKKLAEADEDPDAADAEALEVASQLPGEPAEAAEFGVAGAEGELVEGGVARGLHITGLRTIGGRGSASRFSGLFGSEDSSSEEDVDEDDIDEDEAGRDETAGRAEGNYDDPTAPVAGGVGRRRSQKERRPSTTEAKERAPLDDDEDEDNDDDDDDCGGGLGARMQGHMGLGEGPFADPVEMSSEEDSEDELVEIRPTRRTSS